MVGINNINFTPDTQLLSFERKKIEEERISKHQSESTTCIQQQH
jgi:hypothetical protein